MEHNTTRQATIEATMNAGALHLQFSNGETVSVALSNLTPEIQQQCAMHGLKQKLVDAAAISRNPDTGRSATVDDKLNAVLEVANRLLSGQWNKTRDGGAGSGNGGLLFRALCQLYADKTPEAIREFLGKKDAKEQAALRALPKVARIIDELRAAKAKDDIDTDAMLDELEG